LLLLVVVVAMMAVPLDLAGIEPFDAYLVRTAGLATIGVAVVGLVASFFVPQAYCRFGCPTGALLNFVRARGPSDRFSRRDAVALGLVAVAVLINVQYVPLIHWVKGVP
jgi:NosR/NirI family nitrous oxide reductase transcriptional regulator